MSALDQIAAQLRTVSIKLVGHSDQDRNCTEAAQAEDSLGEATQSRPHRTTWAELSELATL